MSVSRLLEDFSRRGQVPISLNDVIEALRAFAVEDEITFHRDESLDPRIVRGYLIRTRGERDGKPLFISRIVYASMSPGEERLVCCKELLHILDPDHIKASRSERVRELLSKIVLPEILAEIVDDIDHVSNDIDTIIEAAAILFPLEQRNYLYDHFARGHISADWIADKLELSEDVILMAMNGYWPQIVQSLIGRRQRLEENRDPPRASRKLRTVKG